MTTRNTEVTLTASTTTFASSYTVSTTGTAVTASSSVALTNLGTILSSGGDGVNFGDGGVLINAGIIEGGTNNLLFGISFDGAGYVDNTGFIEANTGIVFTSGAGAVRNSGTVIGHSGTAIWVQGTFAATINNSGLLLEEAGTLSASGGALYLNGTGVVTNTGSIISQNTKMAGGADGILIGSGTVINAGLIQGAVYKGTSISVDFSGAGGDDLLVLDAGQTLVGEALAHGTGNTLALATGTAAVIGTISNPGNYVDFQTLAVNQGADWTVGSASTTGTFASIVTALDAGTLNIAGTVDIAAGIVLTGAGSLNVGLGAALVDTGKSPAVLNSYTVGVAANFTDLGTIAAASGYAAVKLTSGSLGSHVTVGSSTDTTALLAGGGYGVELEASGTSANINTVTNFGTITNTGGAGFDAGVVFGFGAGGTFNNFGTVNAASGSAVYFKTVGAPPDTLNNSGLLTNAAGAYSVVFNQADTGAGVLNNTGTIAHGVLLEVGAGLGTVTNAGVIGTVGGTGSLSNVAIHDSTTGVLILDPGQSLSGGIATFGAGSTLDLAGTAGQVGTLVNPGSYFGFTSVTVGTGSDWSIGSSASVSSISGVTKISDFGTLNVAGLLGGTSIDMEGSIAGTATTVDFTGTNTATKIVDYATGDEIIVSTLASAAGDNFKDSYNTATNVLTITEFNAAGTSIGSSLITVAGAAGVTIATSGSFIELSGPGGDTIVLGNTSLTNANGSIYIDNGESKTLSNTTGVDTIPVTFGTHGTLGAENTLVLNGSVSGTTSPYQGAISGFGLNDDIVIGPSVLPSVTAGERVTLAYTGSLLTVTELNSSGVSIASTTLNVGTGYSASGFVALLGTNGVNIETPATVDEMELTFNASGTANIETPTDYAGGLAPGSSVVAGETVLIASGTASVTSSAPIAVAPTGTIIVSGASSGLIDTGTLGGTGTVDLVNGGHATIGTDLGTINMGGANAGTTLNFSGSSDLSGTTLETTITNFGTLDTIVIGTVDFAATAGNSLATSFNAATGVLTVTDSTTGGTINIDVAPAGSTLSAANYSVSESSAGLVVTENPNPVVTIDNGMSYDIAGTVVSTLAVVFGTHGTSLALNTLDLTGTVTGTNNPYQGSISGFGLNDDIILGPSVLPSVASGDVVTLSYAGSLLTVTELNGSGASIGSTTLNVGTGYSASSFVALLGADGVNIETPATVDETPLTFNTTGTASFEDPTKYSGGLAPGSTIIAGETVIIASGVASITSTAPVTDYGTIIINGGTLITSSSIGGSGTMLLDDGGTLDLTSTAATTQGSTLNATTANVTFGGGGTASDPNVLIQNSTTFGFPGTVSGFGLNDIITAGPAILGFTPGDKLAVSTGGSQLYVLDQTNGKTFGVNFNSAVSAASFVETFGTNGLNIETTATAAEGSFTFNSTGTSSFYSPANYSGDVAPGYSIVSGEVVTIASGSASISSTAPVNNTGTILVNGATSGLIDSSALTGTGTVALANGATITLANTTGTTTNTISFGAASPGAQNVLNLDGTGTAAFAGIIVGEGANDQIDLGGSFLPTPTSASNIGLSFNSATGVLTISDTVGGSVSTDMLTFSGVVPGTFAAAIGAGGIVITDVPCFAAGTRILTPDGQVAVERLAVGDTVLTARDGATQKIIWAGSRTVDLARHAMPEKVIPVVILAGAFGDGLPERDLKLSPDHALFIDGGLIEAKTLVNGTTVIRDKSLRYVTYHHIELERHDVVLAEGLAAETYLDSGNRQNFDSDAAPLMLHPDFAAASRAGACATLLTDGAIVRAARANLLLRAEALGFTRTDAIDLVVTAGAERIEAMGNRSGNELMFVLPAGTRDIALLSATGVPAELSADPSDRRALGAALTGLALIAGGKRIEIALDDPAHQGFYGIEDGHRWTNGEARIALPAYSGRAVLEVTLHGQAARWQAPLSVTA